MIRFQNGLMQKRSVKPSKLGLVEVSTVPSTLEAHGPEVSTEDANHKFLRIMPSSRSNLAMTNENNIQDLQFNLLMICTIPLEFFEQEIPSLLAHLLLLQQKVSEKERFFGFADEKLANSNDSYTKKKFYRKQKKEWYSKMGHHEGKEEERPQLYNIQEAGSKRMNSDGYEEEMNFSVFKCSKEDSIGKPSYSRFTKTNDFKGVPHPLSGDYSPKPQEEIDDSMYVYGKKGPQKPEISVSDENSSEHSTCQTMTVKDLSVQLNAGRPKFNSVRPNINTGWTNINSGRPKVNTVSSKVNTVRTRQPIPHKTSNSLSPKRPQMNQINQRRDFSKSYSSVRNPLPKSTAQMAHSMLGPTFIRTVNANGPQGRPKPAKAWYKDQLEDFEEFNGGSVTFGGSKGYISGKGRIRVGIAENIGFSSSFNHRWQIEKQDKVFDVSSFSANDFEYSNRKQTPLSGCNSKANPNLQFLLSFFGTISAIENTLGMVRDCQHGLYTAGGNNRVDEMILARVSSGFAGEKKSKEQVLQKEASLAEAIRLDTLQKEEVAKQVHLDSLLAQRIAEEEELNEQQKKRKAQVQFEAQHYTNEDWDLIRAKIEANAELSKSMLGSELQGEDFAKKMVDLVNQRKKYFAEERARAKRNKPMTQSQLKTYMMNYLKNQGTWKLSQLKKLSFEEVKKEFDKLVKQVESFAPINFEATKASLKRFGEELQTKTPKRLKDDEAKDDEQTKKSGKRRKQMARRGLHTNSDKDDSVSSDEVSEQDDSVTGTQTPINPVPVAMKTPSIATYKIIKQGEKGVYQIVREDGTDIVYINFGAMLKSISRDDLTELYRIVMNRYGMNGPEDELEKSEWLTGKETSNPFKIFNDSPLTGVNTPGSDENRLKLYDLMYIIVNVADMMDC
ncbi:hypothetical protein Tco_0791886 [Tanacetum coccineum]